MLITINILSAMSIVMALFIPYFILLHLNNKLRKEVEGALNRILEVKQYSEQTREALGRFIQNTNENNEGQNDNWKNYDANIDLITKALKLCQQRFDVLDKDTKDAFRLHSKLHDKTIEFMEKIEKIVNQKQTLKEILESPIEVTKPTCETKVNLMGTEIVNKVDFNHGKSNFKIGDVFRKTEDTVFISRDGEYIKILNLNNTYGKNIYNKFLQLNEN
jgi:hypothetical protein